MKNRTLQFLLVIAIMLVLIGTFWNRWRITKLTPEADRLGKLVGYLAIEDPRQLHAVLVESKQPFEYVWRVYIPGGERWRLANETLSGGGWSTFGSQEPSDRILRWHIVRDADAWILETLGSSGSSRSTISDAVYDFLSDHWEELDIAVLGEQQSEEAKGMGIADLLSISVPDELLAVAEERLGKGAAKKLHAGPMFQIRVGLDKSFIAEEKRLENRKK